LNFDFIDANAPKFAAFAPHLRSWQSVGLCQIGSRHRNLFLKHGIMIEVFKTNVTQRRDAYRLIETLHLVFSDYKANFDLQDCDRILRIVSRSGHVDADSIIQFLGRQGFEAEVLEDIIA